MQLAEVKLHQQPINLASSPTSACTYVSRAKIFQLISQHVAVEEVADVWYNNDCETDNKTEFSFECAFLLC